MASYRRALESGESVDLVTGLSKLGESVLRIIEDEGRWELRRWLHTGLRVAEHLSGLMTGRHDELPAHSDPVRRHEQAAGGPAVATGTQAAKERPAEDARAAGHVHAPSSPTVEATTAEIRAWAREHDLAVGDRGLISKRIIEAYALAHAS